MHNDDLIPLIIERLPSPSTMNIFARLRANGWDWESIEARMDDLASDMADGGMPFSGEAEQYVRRLIIAAHAYETRGANN